MMTMIPVRILPLACLIMMAPMTMTTAVPTNLGRFVVAPLQKWLSEFRTNNNCFPTPRRYLGRTTPPWRKRWLDEVYGKDQWKKDGREPTPTISTLMFTSTPATMTTTPTTTTTTPTPTTTTTSAPMMTGEAMEVDPAKRIRVLRGLSILAVGLACTAMITLAISFHPFLKKNLRVTWPWTEKEEMMKKKKKMSEPPPETTIPI